jgi:hypothetical protein
MRPLRLVLGCIVVLGIGCLRMQSHTGSWPCTSIDDCEVGEKCVFSSSYGTWGPSPGTKMCMPASFCTMTTDCASHERCEGQSCVPAECTTKNDPACGPYDCELSTRTCYGSCYGGSEYCSADHVCSAKGTCIDDVCLSIAPEGVCPGGYLCSNGACPTSCSSNAGCATGYTCSSSRCSANAGAPDAGAPKDAGAKPAPEAAPSGNPLFSVCAKSTDCQSRACCYTSSLTEYRCFNSCTVLPIGSPCHGNADCESGLCHITSGTLGFCTKSCTSDAQCGLNYYDSMDGKNLCVTANNLDFYCFPGCNYSASCEVNCGRSCVCQQVDLDAHVCTP